MLGKTMLLRMYEYDHQINSLLLDCAAKVTPEQWDAPHEYGQGSLHQIMYHLLRVEQGWLYLCQHHERIKDRPSIEALPTVESLRAYSEEIYATTRVFLEGLSEEDIASSFTIREPDGEEDTAVMWHILTHVLYHSAQHRSEIAALLTSYDQSPGDLDFLYFVD